jgi:hypothetical protein
LFESGSPEAETFDQPIRYGRIQPGLVFTFENCDPRDYRTKTLSAHHFSIWQRFLPPCPTCGGLFTKNNLTYDHYWLNRYQFNWNEDRALHPFEWNAGIEHNADFMKIQAEGNFHISYKKAQKGLNIRVFAGVMPVFPDGNAVAPDVRFRTSFTSGNSIFQKDYTYEETILDRNGDNFFSQQVVQRDGGFRSGFLAGQVSDFLFSVNLNTVIWKKVPLRPYASLAAYSNGSNQFSTAFEMGIAIVLIEELVEINFPIFVSAGTKPANSDGFRRKWYPGFRGDSSENLYIDAGYGEIITFTFNLNPANPFRMIRDLKFL